MKIKTILLLTLITMGSTNGFAQLSKNPNKFLGNITTSYSIRSDFGTYWNQLTPENETKWASVEGTRDVFNWSTVDKEYNYCKTNKIPFKFHTLIWGGQYPSWMNNLSQKDQLDEITEWFDAAAARYPDLDYIDVVNEALPGHAPAPFKNALGGDGVSGYDWIVKAFIMARERWPKAVLIYNDYNTFMWNTDAYIDLLKKIKAAGAPVDVAGCQAHDLGDMSGADFKTVLYKIHNQTGLPIVISEYDISKQSDQEQLKRYSEQIPVMWEADFVAGVTLWGYIYGSTWVDHSGLIKNGVERPAMTWLREYMLTEAAINAKSPLMNVSEYAYITASQSLVEVNTEISINAKASTGIDSIGKMQIFVNNALLCDTTESSVALKWTPTTARSYTLKLKVYNKADSLIFQKTCTVKAYDPPTPFNSEPLALPGVLEAENFDNGVNQITYNDKDNTNEGGQYRSNCGVDIGSQATNEYFVGWTSAGEWMDYTVTVNEREKMNFTARVSSANSDAAIKIYMGRTSITDTIFVPKSPNGDWSRYTEVKGQTRISLPIGTYKLRLVIERSSCNIDKITFTGVKTGIEDEEIDTFDGVYEVYSITGIKVGVVEISNGDVSGLKDKYPNGVYIFRKQDGSGEPKRILIH